MYLRPLTGVKRQVVKHRERSADRANGYAIVGVDLLWAALKSYILFFLRSVRLSDLIPGSEAQIVEMDAPAFAMLHDVPKSLH